MIRFSSVIFNLVAIPFKTRLLTAVEIFPSPVTGAILTTISTIIVSFIAQLSKRKINAKFG